MSSSNRSHSALTGQVEYSHRVMLDQTSLKNQNHCAHSLTGLKKKPRWFTWTHSRNSFEPVSIEDVIDLVNDTPILLNCYCLTKAGYHALEEFDVTISFIPGHTLCTHLYKIEPLPGLETCVFWMTYKICCEILVRLGPTVLLIAMNVAIIRNFNLSVRRKKKLKASKFVKRTSSQLFPNSNCTSAKSHWKREETRTVFC